MSDLSHDIEAYVAMREDLEKKYTGKWVLIHDKKLISVYESFTDAADDAVKKFAEGPYLIRQVGAPPVVLPASVMYVMKGYARG